MGTISINTPYDGTTADVADVNTPLNTIVNEINGNLDNANIKAAAGIAGSKLANAAITPDKLGLGGAQTLVATSQTTTNTSYTDLSTAGPAQTVTIGVNGLALVILGCSLQNNANGNGAVMSWEASGANTVAAADAQSLYFVNSNTAANAVSGASRVYLASGLTPGSTTFTAKYRAAGGGTATFSDRYITVIPL